MAFTWRVASPHASAMQRNSPRAAHATLPTYHRLDDLRCSAILQFLSIRLYPPAAMWLVYVSPTAFDCWALRSHDHSTITLHILHDILYG